MNPDKQTTPRDAHDFFDARHSAEVVIGRMAGCQDERLREIMSVVVRHLHQAVQEIRPTQAEWMAAIEFLTSTGQMCSEWRQEFILLSDVLGVSMLVDALNHDGDAECTESTVLGPFHVAGAPLREAGENLCLDDIGEPLLVTGRVTDEHGCPVAGACLDVWQANAAGYYDVQQPDVQPRHNLRGRFLTDKEGQFRFRTVRPLHYAIPHDGPVGRMLSVLGREPIRPAHIHFIVSADGFRSLTTHLFVAGDPYLSRDAVFGVKQSLIADIESIDDPALAAAHDMANPLAMLSWEFRLAREEAT